MADGRVEGEAPGPAVVEVQAARRRRGPRASVAATRRIR
jgi:hypothetical protein